MSTQILTMRRISERSYGEEVGRDATLGAEESAAVSVEKARALSSAQRRSGLRKMRHSAWRRPAERM